MTTDTVALPESARRFHEMYRSDLSRVEPVSDAQILAAIAGVARGTLARSVARPQVRLR
jgi:hypothetical protein